MELWFSTLWTTNRISPPFLRIHPIETWPRILLNRKSIKPHHYLINPLSHKIYANKCLRPDTDPPRLYGLPNIQKEGHLWAPFSAKLELLHTNSALKRHDEPWNRQHGRTMEPATRTDKANDKPTSTAYIPHTQKNQWRTQQNVGQTQ